ncbi:MAG TPA: hypothetical protein VFA24_04895 [Gaiellaceae bacterium]|nr:hypothetical protein [Gaiellaceae bacterium]
MGRRETAVASLVAAIAVAAAGTAAAATDAATRNCGTTRAAGRTWSVLATGVSCPVAAGLVRGLAAKYDGGGLAPLGTPMKMRCLGTSGAGGARGILCSGAARSVVASSRR